MPSRRSRPRRWWSLTPPFHPYPVIGAVCFLWRYPAGHPGSPLAIVLPCGARTFLSLRRGRPAGSEPARRIELRLPPYHGGVLPLSLSRLEGRLPLLIWDSRSWAAGDRTPNLRYQRPALCHVELTPTKSRPPVPIRISGLTRTGPQPCAAAKCARRDSNPHALTGTSTSTMRVYLIPATSAWSPLQILILRPPHYECGAPPLS